MPIKKLIFHVVVLILLGLSPARADEPLVVASIKPVHSLVAYIMDGTGVAPKLIVDGSQSPHGFQLKPSHRQALAQADVVFYIDDYFENFLPAAIEHSKEGAQHIALMKAAPLHVLKERFADPNHTHGGGTPYNYHVWLSAANASTMAQKIAETLAARYPEHEAKYMENARALRTELQRLDVALSHELAPVIARPFLVFHDGYHYFEERYGLNAVGSITQDPNQSISSVRLLELRQQIKQAKVRCVFREPQFPSRLADQIVEGTGARIGLIDPEGATISPGKDLIVTLYERLAENYLRCLKEPEEKFANDETPNVVTD
jgi:zinc transport system substrate-binding protein